MNPAERLYVVYYFLAAISLVLGVWWGHALTVRSWTVWWSELRTLFRAEIRRIIREELEHHDVERQDPPGPGR